MLSSGFTEALYITRDEEAYREGQQAHTESITSV